MLCTYEIDCGDLIDLRKEAGRQKAGIAEDDMVCPWFAEAAAGQEPPSWRLARQLIEVGAAGMLAPSFAAAAGPDDRTLVLWRWSDRMPHKVVVFDPSGRLPKNQLSWA